MNSIFVAIIAALFSPSVGSHNGSNEINGFSYVCYVQNENLMLCKSSNGGPEANQESIDTGISTNFLEDVTIDIQNQFVVVTASYNTGETIRGFFDKTTMDLNQICCVDQHVLFANSSLPE